MLHVLSRAMDKSKDRDSRAHDREPWAHDREPMAHDPCFLAL